MMYFQKKHLNKFQLKSLWSVIFMLFVANINISCEQKELCYAHNHTSMIKVNFDWRNAPEANPSSMLFYLFPTEEASTIKREFIGKDGGISQALAGISYIALGFNSDIKNTTLKVCEEQASIEAISKTSANIDKIGISSSALPRAEESKSQRMSKEADKLWSATSEDNIYIPKEEYDKDITYNITLFPQQRYCTYRIKILNIENTDKISPSVAASLSGLAGGVNLTTGKKLEEDVTIPFSINIKDSSIEGSFLCYGNSINQSETNKLVIYTIMKDGTKWYYVYDVTKQIQDAPDPYNVEIILNNLPVPNKMEGDSGLYPSVNDWNIIEIPLGM